MNFKFLQHRYSFHYWSRSSDWQRVLVMFLWKINAFIEPRWGFLTVTLPTRVVKCPFTLSIRHMTRNKSYWVGQFFTSFFPAICSGALLLYMTCLISSQQPMHSLLFRSMLVQFQKPSKPKHFWPSRRGRCNIISTLVLVIWASGSVYINITGIWNNIPDNT